MPNIKPIPARLKKLESSDLLPIKDLNGDYLVVTKQETNLVIKELLEVQSDALLNDKVKKIVKSFETIVDGPLKKGIDVRLDDLSRDVEAHINYRIDNLAKNITEMLITKNFNDEVNRKVEEKLKNIKTKGKF
jgi:hypothetical protein